MSGSWANSPIIPKPELRYLRGFEVRHPYFSPPFGVTNRRFGRYNFAQKLPKKAIKCVCDVFGNKKFRNSKLYIQPNLQGI